jgi:hypothetical protein
MWLMVCNNIYQHYEYLQVSQQASMEQATEPPGPTYLKYIACSIILL